MRKIYDAKEDMAKYDELEPMTDFLYQSKFGYEFPAFKITDKHAVLLNAKGKFIIAEKFDNCLDIGASAVPEYDSIADAVKWIRIKEDIAKKKERMI